METWGRNEMLQEFQETAIRRIACSPGSSNNIMIKPWASNKARGSVGRLFSLRLGTEGYSAGAFGPERQQRLKLAAPPSRTSGA